MDKSGVSSLDRPAAELTVVDVYDIAALLGQEFERIIDRYGCEVMVGLVPKVVRVLELLEALVNYGEARHKADELQRELDRVRQERDDRHEQDRKHQMELELVEDLWRSEVQDLLCQISELQKDNKKLLLSQTAPEPPLSEEHPQEQEEVSEKEQEVLERLRELVEKQREDIRSKEHELTLRSHDFEALQLQQSRLMKMNQDLRHRLALLENQGKLLVQQRAELEVVAQVRLQQLGTLGQEVSRLQRELQDMNMDRQEERLPVFFSGLCTESVSPTAAAPLTTASPASPDSEHKPSSVWVECAGDPEFLASCFEKEMFTKACETDSTPLLSLDRSGAGTEEHTDQDGLEDSPQFTLQELRDVLHERNQLKAQVFLLQEELAYYNTEEDHSLCTYSSSPDEDDDAAAASAAVEPEPESGIRRLIFTAIMPMVAAGLISDDPTLMPIRRLVSIV